MRIEGIIKYCAECGKEFFVTDPMQYIYKRQQPNKGKLYYCGWNCYRKHEIRKGIDRNGKKTEVI